MHLEDLVNIWTSKDKLQVSEAVEWEQLQKKTNHFQNGKQKIKSEE